MIITNDSHYLRKEDADAQDSLLCLQTNADKSDPNRFHFPNNEFYVKTPEEMEKDFKNIPQALENTVKIAERCNVEIEFGVTKLPHYDVPDGYNSYSYLRFLCEEGGR